MNKYIDKFNIRLDKRDNNDNTKVSIYILASSI